MGLSGSGPTGHSDHFIASYIHVDFHGFLHFNVNQQIGVPLLPAAVAELVGEVKPASSSRGADQNARIQARFLAAQRRFLLSDTTRNRLQLNEARAQVLEDLCPPEG